MLGEEGVLLFPGNHSSNDETTILEFDAAEEASADGETEMVNPVDFSSESDCDQDECSGRSELQEVNGAYEGSSAGESVLAAGIEIGENLVLEQLDTTVKSYVELRNKLEVSEAASEDEAHAKAAIGTIGREKSTFDNAVAQHTTETTHQEILAKCGQIDYGSSEENKGRGSNANEEAHKEQANSILCESECLEVGTETDEERPLLSPEYERVTIPQHWHPKPCVQVSGLGGLISQEELMSLLTKHAPIASIVFENERRDSVIARLQASPTEEDEVVSALREALNNTHFKDRTLMVGPFSSDSLLFIGNLTPEIDDELLKEMFEPHGRIERAFVLHNEEGRSKGYGFVEYSLKSEASAAKQIMGNINMDGRVLRVEWSDCKKVADMFSTVLFVDRIAKECPNIESILKTLFGEYGKVCDCHLAIAHEALDGREVEASNIRVSFANPSKSAQSYKSRFGSQGTLSGLPARGLPGVMPTVMGAAMRSCMAMPFLAPRFLNPRPGMLGMGLAMQFGSGAPIGPGIIGPRLTGPVLGAGCMLGPGCIHAAGMLSPAPGLLLGPFPVSPAAIAQVATAQAKAREIEAKVRTEFQRLQQAAQQAQILKQSGPIPYQQQQAQAMTSEGDYSYQQFFQQMKQHTYTPQATPQLQQAPVHSLYSSYYPQSGQHQSSQPQAADCQQQQQLSGQHFQYAQQYDQQQPMQQYTPQHYAQTYKQTTTQSFVQQCIQYHQPFLQQQHVQQVLEEYYSQQQQHQQESTTRTVNSQSQDVDHQHVYQEYYQPQTQLVVTQAHSVSQSATMPGSRDTLEAQWAAYYAAQQAADQDGVVDEYKQQGAHGEQVFSGTAIYLQPPAVADFAQKRSADHLNYTSQNQQIAYNFNPNTVTHQQQTTATDSIYQQQNASSMPGSLATSAGQHQITSAAYTASYQQPGISALPTYPQPASSSYYLQLLGAHQQQSQGISASAPLAELNKRPRY